jgi:F-type H+-transporting ATPase subunit epsilon
MAKTLQLDIITPERTLFSGAVTSFIAPGAAGSFQILYNHAPFLSALAIGPMRILDEEGKERKFATSGGFAQVYRNRITVLAETAEAAESIDVARAFEARRRAEARLRGEGQAINEQRAKIALLRAINRLRVAGAE